MTRWRANFLGLFKHRYSKDVLFILVNHQGGRTLLNLYQIQKGILKKLAV